MTRIRATGTKAQVRTRFYVMSERENVVVNACPPKNATGGCSTNVWLIHSPIVDPRRRGAISPKYQCGETGSWYNMKKISPQIGVPQYGQSVRSEVLTRGSSLVVSALNGAKDLPAERAIGNSLQSWDIDDKHVCVSSSCRRLNSVGVETHRLGIFGSNEWEGRVRGQRCNWP